MDEGDVTMMMRTSYLLLQLAFSLLCPLIIGDRLFFPTSAKAEEVFFPIATKDAPHGLTVSEAEWYSKSLIRMEEPSLSHTQKGDPTWMIRFLLLPTWGPPLSVRVEEKGETARIIGKRLGGQGGYDPGHLVQTVQRELSPTEWQTLRQLFESIRFSELPTKASHEGLDGEQWILEASATTGYHLAVRWSANSFDPKKRGTLEFVNICESLLKLASLKDYATNKGRPLFNRSTPRPNGGAICLGPNQMFVPYTQDQHVQIVIDDLHTFDFISQSESPRLILHDLDIHSIHDVKVYSGSRIIQSWKLDFRKFPDKKVQIWRSPGYWRLGKLHKWDCQENQGNE